MTAPFRRNIARRFRKPPEPTGADLKILRRLVVRALRLADHPLNEQDRLRLQRSAIGSERACLPVSHQRRDSEFRAVIALGKQWFRLSAEERAARADELRAAALICQAALDAAPTTLRLRADIDD